MQRDFKLDTLKAIALLCIILAHVAPPAWLMQMRNFDVPLMVLISGDLAGRAITKKKLNYFEYLKKRVFRLVKPVWIFLVIFFIFMFAIVDTPHA